MVRHNTYHHDLLHLPMEEWCKSCQSAKLNKKPAWRQDPSTKDLATEFGGRLQMDTIGPVVKSPGGYNIILVCRDEATDHAAVDPLRDRASRTVARSFTRLYPPGCGVKKVRVDSGGEFEGAFQSLCGDRQITMEISGRRRSTSHGRAERFHRTLEEAVRTFLHKSGFPFPLARGPADGRGALESGPMEGSGLAA